ncbi:hypothetical protein MBLNU230_g0031t1 [Neophaeotheca triangularis]
MSFYYADQGQVNQNSWFVNGENIPNNLMVLRPPSYWPGQSTVGDPDYRSWHPGFWYPYVLCPGLGAMGDPSGGYWNYGG